LRKTAVECGDERLGEASAAVLQNFYVDDCLCATETDDDATELAHDLQTLCARGGFRLTKFVSNSRHLLASVSREDRGKQVKELNLNRDVLPAERVLGIKWTVQTDLIGLDVGSPDRAHTRRGMLSVVGSMYDPIGLTAPVLLSGRLILQDMARLQLGWDVEAPPALQKRWDSWTRGLQELSKVSVERCYTPLGFGAVVKREVHHFCDASSHGYGTVAYLRVVSDSGQVHVSFLFGKSRLAPIKSVSIPRLELTAATLSVRINSLILRALQIPIDSIVYWTDSTTVLRYIYNERTRFHVFVANRLTVIHDGSSPNQWRHISSGSNPADVASRGLDGAALTSEDKWLHGPVFLKREEDSWPRPPEGLEQPLLSDPEVKTTVLSTLVPAEDGGPLGLLFARYSSWYRLRRAVAWLLRVKSKLYDLVKNKLNQVAKSRVPTSKHELHTPTLAVAELQRAESAVLVRIQKVSFPEEYVALQASRSVKSASRLARLDPFLEDDLIKVGGRLTNASLSGNHKHPVILPRDHHVVDLIVQQTHEDVGHQGREHVLAELRTRYWILKGNSAVRRVLSRCISCQRRQGPVSGQKLADLPADRVRSDEPPFTNTGIDLFGPFYVKRGRGQEKRYGVVFTCLVTRAVHIEVAASQSTDSFICALRRFLARRGHVKRIRTDRGTNFVGASKELLKELECLTKSESAIHEAMLRKNVEWVFNPPTASHHGGTWERMIRSIRKILDALLLQQVLTDEVLQTLLCEIEAILNSRPLTYVSSDHRDPEPLTPNHLLLLGGSVPVPRGVFKDDDLYAKRRWRQTQYLADLFWSRWRKEYLPLLQHRQRWFYPERSLSVGDVVLIADEGLPRSQWPLGRVIETHVSSDGLVRSVRIRSKGTELCRPITKLVFIC